jgi:hypothetical protein
VKKSRHIRSLHNSHDEYLTGMKAGIIKLTIDRHSVEEMGMITTGSHTQQSTESPTKPNERRMSASAFPAIPQQIHDDALSV